MKKEVKITLMRYWSGEKIRNKLMKKEKKC